MTTKASWTLEELKAMPTLESSHYKDGRKYDLKFEDRRGRVWLFRDEGYEAVRYERWINHNLRTLDENHAPFASL